MSNTIYDWVNVSSISPIAHFSLISFYTPDIFVHALSCHVCDFSCYRFIIKHLQMNKILASNKLNQSFALSHIHTHTHTHTYIYIYIYNIYIYIYIYIHIAFIYVDHFIILFCIKFRYELLLQSYYNSYYFFFLLFFLFQQFLRMFAPKTCMNVMDWILMINDLAEMSLILWDDFVILVSLSDFCCLFCNNPLKLMHI